MLADVPNESTWRTDIKPVGLHKIANGISKDTAKKLWRFFRPHKAKPGETKPTDAMAAMLKMHEGSNAPKDGSGIKCDPDREVGSFPWVKRFTRYKTCHYNSGHFNVADVPEIEQAVIEALESTMKVSDSKTLSLMTDTAELSVAIMKHEPNWGLGRVSWHIPSTRVYRSLLTRSAPCFAAPRHMGARQVWPGHDDHRRQHQDKPSSVPVHLPTSWPQV
jgi:hypothetical protein